MYESKLYFVVGVGVCEGLAVWVVQLRVEWLSQVTVIH